VRIIKGKRAPSCPRRWKSGLSVCTVDATKLIQESQVLRCAEARRALVSRCWDKIAQSCTVQLLVSLDVFLTAVLTCGAAQFSRKGLIWKQELKIGDPEDSQEAEHNLISTNLKPCRLSVH